MRSEKKTFLFLLAFLAVSLVLIPFVMTFNNFLSAVVESSLFYKLIQRTILPGEIRLTGVVLQFFRINVQVSRDTLYLQQGARKEAIYIGWNCLGWQSFLLFLASLTVGFQGGYSRFSKLIAAAIGLLGIFLINIFRIALVAWLIFRFDQLAALVFHDYFAVFITLIWLVFFWWFAYTFVLEKKERKTV